MLPLDRRRSERGFDNRARLSAKLALKMLDLAIENRTLATVFNRVTGVADGRPVAIKGVGDVAQRHVADDVTEVHRKLDTSNNR